MWEKLLVILLVIIAVAGIVLSVRRQRRQSCDASCRDCPLYNACTKPDKQPADQQ
ncbi:MAG: FeoB-associated Cys-rich membrane protein [Paludibacteraceae bacterium]